MHVLQVAPLGEPLAPLEQPLVVPRVRVDVVEGCEQVAPDELDLALDVALLVARPRVAEAVVEPVVGREGLEGLDGAHDAADAPAHPGGIVEHDTRRTPLPRARTPASGLGRRTRSSPVGTPGRSPLILF